MVRDKKYKKKSWLYFPARGIFLPTNQPHGTEELVFAAKDNRLSLWVAPFYTDALRLVYTLGREDTVQRERKITE
jgi:hypothetical protein